MSNIQFEHIEPYIDGVGDTGLSSRQKLRRNFEKIKAWMDSVATQLSGKYLSKEEDDEAAGVITFNEGVLFGASGAWGYVKQVAVNGAEVVKSWFKNLWTDVLTVTGYLTGDGGQLAIKGDVGISKDTSNGRSGNLSVAGKGTFGGDLSTGGDVNARNGSVNASGGHFNDVTTTNLTVTGLAHFFELVIDSVKSAGGAALFTPADGFRVEAVTHFYYTDPDSPQFSGWRIRLYWRATDGERAIKNMWRAGMQAICKNFNEVAQPGHYDNVGNHHYWAVVAYANTEHGTPIWDERNPDYVKAKAALADPDAVPANTYEVTDWHFIDLYSNAEAPADRHSNLTYWDGNPTYDGEPWTAAVGDNIAQLGYRGQDDDSLKNALYISAYTSLDEGDPTLGIRGLQAPLIAYYEGVDDFNLSKHRTTFKDAKGGEWVGDMKIVVDAEGTTMTLNDYVNSVVDIDADFYRLRPVQESATVDASKKLSVTLDYQLEHVSGGSAEVLNSWSGFTVSAQNDAGTSDGTWRTSGRDRIFELTINNYSEAQNPTYFTVQLRNAANTIIAQRIVRVTMKAGAVFEVTDSRIAAAVQDINGDMAQMRSEFEMTAEGIRTEVSKIPVSRNLLLNSDFAEVGRDYLPLQWGLWYGASGGTMNDFAVRQVAGEKWRAAYMWPGEQFTGIKQDSRVLGGGKWGKVLRHGGYYALSFWALTEAAEGTSRADALMHIYKVDGSTGDNPTPVGDQPLTTLELTHDWQRKTVAFQVLPPAADRDLEGYAFRVMLGCLHADVPQDERLVFSRPQLEEITQAQYEAWVADNSANVGTEWHRGEENVSVQSTQIKQNAEEIGMSVKVDGVERSGLRLDGNGVEIKGDKLRITGAIESEVEIEGALLKIKNDLDLQGLTTENVTRVERNAYLPTVINMGIVGEGEAVVKSVQVVDSADASQSTPISDHLVVLPFYDSRNDYWTESFGGITVNLDNTFNLYGGKKVVQWTKSGTRLTVTNSVVFKFRNWQNIGSGSTGAYSADALEGLVVVCADGRVVCAENLVAGQYNPSDSDNVNGQMSSQKQLHAGLFSCGGYLSRFIILLPGQSLQLRSQIASAGGRDVLIWVVENPSEFVPFYKQNATSQLRFVGAATLDYVSKEASFNASDNLQGYVETIMAPAALNLRTDRTITFDNLY